MFFSLPAHRNEKSLSDVSGNGDIGDPVDLFAGIGCSVSFATDSPSDPSMLADTADGSSNLLIITYIYLSYCFLLAVLKS